MNKVELIAEYLRSPAHGDWRWEKDGSAIIWGDGSTVAFRAEIRALLELFEPHGLPPFGAIVVILAALRGKLPHECLDPIAPAATDPRGQLLLSFAEKQRRTMREAFDLLTQVAPRLQATGKDRALLIDAVLERAPRTTTAGSGAIAAALDHSFAQRLDAIEESADLPRRMLQLVLDGLRPYTADTLLARVRTGLDVAPVPNDELELELPREERARRLFASLEKDEELGGVAQIARDLMAALRLPQLLVEPDELALGGAADLTNRGPLDRLLLSELAYDDLTLATRVALNEALYLRREPPVHKPERGLAILLDAGLRMWGVPRVLGLAASLALLSARELRGVAEVWRPHGRKIESVDLLARAGLDAHLAALTTELNPGPAIPAWSAAIGALGEVDAVLVTHRDALADRAFQARLADAAIERGFLVLVERDGSVELHALPWGSPRPLAAAKVDVEKLLPRPKAKFQQQRPAPPPLLEPELAELPAFFRQRPYPLLVPVIGKVARAVSLPGGGGGLCAMQDGRLYHWKRDGRGACLLGAGLPTGRVVWLGVDRAKRFALVVKGSSGTGSATLSLAPMDGSRSVRILPFPSFSESPHVHLDGDVAQLLLRNRVVTIGLESAEVLAETPIPAGLRWLNGRYFRGANGIQFVSWNGSAAVWESALSGQKLGAGEIVVVFDHAGVGAWVLMRDGRLFSPGGTEVLRITKPIRAEYFVPTDEGFLLNYGSTIAPSEVKLVPPSIADAKPWRVAQELHFERPPSRGLWAKRVSKIQFSPEHGLQLLGRSGECSAIAFDPQRGLTLFESKPGTDPIHAFENWGSNRSRKLGFSCRIARTPKGTTVWIDSRGLIHLRSHDPELAEVTLALPGDGHPIAGWASTGGVCGPIYFRPPGEPEDALKVRDALQAIAKRA